MRTLEILQSTFVVPSENTPRERLVLSNLDLVAVRKHNCTIYLYKNNEGAKDFFSVEVIKSALAKTLVLFYPLAGRHVIGLDGRDQIDCNTEGVLFVVARLDCTADSIQFEPMSPDIRELFFPKEPQSSSLLQMLQVTYLKCGSVVLGTSNNHIVVDGRGAAHFFQTWSRIARGDLTNIVPPSFDRTPLCARSPPKISFNFPEYTTDESKKESNPKPCVLNLFKLSKEQIRHLKIQCTKHSNKTFVSTFCVVSALVWKCYCKAQGLALGSNSRLYFTADIRNRIHPPIPNYFGNGVIRLSATSEVSKITSSQIGEVAGTVKAVIDGLTDEFIKSFIDYMEVMREKKISVISDISESDLRIRTILGMPIYDIDFGWGSPQLVSWERCTENRVVYLMNEPGEDAGIKVVVSLDSSTMKQFQKVFYEELKLFSDE
ncbi:HXXXD-type acyl-transferase family protein [Rhynchospora pubera]|uniref:HXXXD-type acyl-transferase family protein n=1 Tax=Rhynchospora pubera TaxID=906938 RepID=A0AAV8CZ08_9POAL|nr:HXXXD-type acyl-transferase family protein [Rhynchospora pubera]KAJ4813688.1 HXXXD-type acyl-transferase family protein [Rhynchospora pubera]